MIHVAEYRACIWSCLNAAKSLKKNRRGKINRGFFGAFHTLFNIPVICLIVDFYSYSVYQKILGYLSL